MRAPTLAVKWTALLVLLSGQAQLTLATVDMLPWPNAVEILTSVCPYGEICGIPPIKHGYLTTCCSDCSCEADCAETSLCCFPKINKTDEETCMFPRSKFADRFVQSTSDSLVYAYYIVTKTPPGGCINGATVACMADTSIPFSPVSSPKTKKVYYNRACADCHGVDEIYEWDSALICDPLGSSTTVDFEKEITNYLRDPDSSSCFIAYFINGEMNAYDRACMLPDVESLFENKNEVADRFIAPHINMTAEEVLEACKTNFYSPVKTKTKWYPNPFCYIYDEGGAHAPRCLRRTENVLGVEYMALLSNEVKSVLQTMDEKPIVAENMACLANHSSTQALEHPFCRGVACPFGHIHDRDGNCIFMGSSVYLKSRRSFSAHILLRSIDDIVDDDDNVTLATYTLANITNGLQLPSEWKVRMFGIPANRQTTQRDEVLVRLWPETNDINSALKDLKVHLSNLIVLDDGHTKRTFTQHIYPFSLTYNSTSTINLNANCTEEKEDPLNDIHDNGTDEDDISALTVNSFNNQSDAMVGNDKHVRGAVQNQYTTGNQHLTTCWQILFVDFRVDIESIEITKMYFCKTIELVSREFQLMEKDNILLYKTTGKYMYEKEFIVIENESGNKTAKICLEDSGFVKIDASGTSKIEAFTDIFVIVSSQCILLWICIISI